MPGAERSDMSAGQRKLPPHAADRINLQCPDIARFTFLEMQRQVQVLGRVVAANPIGFQLLGQLRKRRQHRVGQRQR